MNGINNGCERSRRGSKDTALLDMNAFTKLLAASMNPKAESPLAAYGHLLLRVVAGLMIFYIHGWHKLEGWLAYLQHGTPWKLAEEVAEMHFPAPLASAVAATGVQFICSLFLVVGLITRINAVLLVGVLGVAILQNLLAGRDPQLAILYTLIVATLALLGGGRFSLDSLLQRRCEQTIPKTA